MNANEIANQICKTLTSSEKMLASFGIFPATKMEPVKNLSFDDNRAVTVELMKLCKTS